MLLMLFKSETGGGPPPPTVQRRAYSADWYRNLSLLLKLWGWG